MSWSLSFAPIAPSWHLPEVTTTSALAALAVRIALINTWNRINVTTGQLAGSLPRQAAQAGVGRAW